MSDFVTAHSKESLSSSNQIPEQLSSIQQLVDPLQVLCERLDEFRERVDQLSQTRKNLVSFNEAFSSLLYGLKTNAFCVDFENTPIPESFELQDEKDRLLQKHEQQESLNEKPDLVMEDDTFATNDSFVERP
ncbi:DASH complex subunit Dam1 [Schizosaccharomyces japonicus yFS275]|uniref:DASH complex subunit DAM1 n=1 Tax=Schizosaccharomyces japonicus (strain yFS275 / FY16936) TaxID=402676 RepID=B6K035_SCHJY|nr:DASH complex subunit Dam1 [Schizosaccharomyces japonicus yFS275]EEB06185.1 DASH complex subunit Dam1 [Schizosaccharomyces japonicus yFS275]